VGTGFRKRSCGSELAHDLEKHVLDLIGDGNRLSVAIMPTQKAAPVTATEAKALFSGLDRLPVLLLAVSGGPDSVALMWLAARWCNALKVAPKLIVATVDHGLRKDSKREAEHVGRLARKLGLAHRTLSWCGCKPIAGVQEAARKARYRLLAQAARTAGASHVLTAHTLDDQAETVLIRMSRGSGLRGLAAMQRQTPLPLAKRAPSPLEGEGWGGGSASLEKGTPTSGRASRADFPLAGGGMEASGKGAASSIVRPLLDLPKARLIATLRAAKIPFAEDPSNRDPRFTRARLRGLMPQLAREGLDARRLAQLARRLRRADLAIEAAVDAAEARLVVHASGNPSIGIAADGFARLPAEIALRLLGRAVSRLGDEGPVELAKLEALKAALDSAQIGKGRFRRSLAGALVTLDRDRIAVETAPPRRGRALTTRGRAKARILKTR
jgi:tRNA(Ile)-lysidine synthase